MNRIDRLFAILLHLQGNQTVRAQDLAAKFEVSKRTIYRDLVALSESGVALYGQAGEGYSLLDGFYLPPLVFTDEEAKALFLGMHLLLQQADGSLLVHAKTALEKINVVLPIATRQQVEQLAKIFWFVTPQMRFDFDDRRVLDLQRAIEQKCVVEIVYVGFGRNQSTTRTLDPYLLTNEAGAWYVTGYCHLRQATRTFRLSRIEQMHLLDETFTEIHEIQFPATDQEICIRFERSIIHRVREKQHYGFVAEQETVAGMELRYAVNDLQEIVPWLLGWGSSAEILSPPQLRSQILAEAQKLVSLLT